MVYSIITHLYSIYNAKDDLILEYVDYIMIMSIYLGTTTKYTLRNNIIFALKDFLSLGYYHFSPYI